VGLTLCAGAVAACEPLAVPAEAAADVAADSSRSICTAEEAADGVLAAGAFADDAGARFASAAAVRCEAVADWERALRTAGSLTGDMRPAPDISAVLPSASPSCRSAASSSESNACKRCAQTHERAAEKRRGDCDHTILRVREFVVLARLGRVPEPCIDIGIEIMSRAERLPNRQTAHRRARARF
jgi:hypothetical protein